MPPWKRGLHNAESELAADIAQDMGLAGGQKPDSRLPLRRRFNPLDRDHLTDRQRVDLPREPRPDSAMLNPPVLKEQIWRTLRGRSDKSACVAGEVSDSRG